MRSIRTGGAKRQNSDGAVAVEVSKRLLRLWPWLAAISSGLLGAAALPPLDQTWLIFIALVPLCSTILFSGENIRRCWLRDVLLGYVAGLTFFWSCFFWMTTVTALGWFILQFYLALYFAVWGWFCGLMRPRLRKIVARDKWSEMLARAKPEPLPASSPWLSSGHNFFLALCLTAAWVALEWTRGWLMSGFGWNGLGIALHGTWPLIQIAEFTGVAGVTFLVVFCNAILTTTARRIWEETRSRAMRPHFDLTLTLVGLVAVFLLGVGAVQMQPASHPLHVALVQAAVPRAEKFDIRYKQTIFDKFARLSKIALTSTSNIDLMVWPESAMAAPVLEDQETFEFVSQIASSNRVDVLLGTIEEGRHQVYNAVFRCVENRRPMVRAANTGVTCFVNEFGRVTQILRDDQGSIFEEGTLMGDVNIAAEPRLTFYAQHGELFAKLCTAFAGTILLAKIIFLSRRTGKMV